MSETENRKKLNKEFDLNPEVDALKKKFNEAQATISKQREDIDDLTEEKRYSMNTNEEVLALKKKFGETFRTISKLRADTVMTLTRVPGEEATSSTSEEHRNFVSEPMGEKKVESLPGIGEALGGRLRERGFDKAYKVLGQFLLVGKNEELFTRWLKSISGANTRHASECYQCLCEWCENFL